MMIPDVMNVMQRNHVLRMNTVNEFRSMLNFNVISVSVIVTMAIVVSMVKIKKRCVGSRRDSFLLVGVCRQYLPRTQPCALYEKDDDNRDDETDENNGGKCRKNEECLPPNDRAKHGYCQCKLGFVRRNDKSRCVIDKDAITSTESLPTASPVFDLEIKAGDDQIIKLPTNQIDLSGHILFKSNQSEINGAILKNQNWTASWSLKSSTNNAKVEITNPDETVTHVLVKQLREGNYEFELKVNDDQGRTLASNVVKIDVLPGKSFRRLDIRLDFSNKDDGIYDSFRETSRRTSFGQSDLSHEHSSSTTDNQTRISYRTFRSTSDLSMDIFKGWTRNTDT